MLVVTPDGKTPEQPTVLGKPNGDEPVQVYATGLYKSLMKGETRWVTGDAVDDGLDNGVIVLIGTLVEDTEPDHPAIHPNGGHVGYVNTGRLNDETQVSVETITEVPEGTDADARLAAMSKSELVKLAREVSLEGRAGMDKSELYEHLRHHPDVLDLV